MSHNKVFGFCESKCKVEVPTKAEYDNQIKKLQSPTYIVDSSQKLKDWANNKSGNDYTDVLIKRGTYNDTVTINLTTTKTLRVVGEPDTILANTTIKDAINENTYLLYVNAFSFKNCYNLTYCHTFLKLNSGFEGCSYLTRCSGSFKSCSYLEKCDGLISSIGIYYNGYDRPYNIYASPFLQCSYLTECHYSESANTAKNIIQPKLNELGTPIDSGDYAGGVHYAGFYGCGYVTRCVASAYNDVVKYGFDECTRMWCNYVWAVDEVFNSAYIMCTTDNTTSGMTEGSNKVDDSVSGGFNDHRNYWK